MAASIFLMPWDSNAHQRNVSMNPDDASKSSKQGDLIENHSHSDVLPNKAHENDDISVDLDKRVEDGWHMPHHDHSKCVKRRKTVARVNARCRFHRNDDCKCIQAMKDALLEENEIPDYISSSEIHKMKISFAMRCVMNYKKKNEVKPGV
ncbi:hypothetical protein LINGRAHAP2_LOCUS21890 [Linum grandiflorum]